MLYATPEFLTPLPCPRPRNTPPAMFVTTYRFDQMTVTACFLMLASVGDRLDVPCASSHQLELGLPLGLLPTIVEYNTTSEHIWRICAATYINPRV